MAAAVGVFATGKGVGVWVGKGIIEKVEIGDRGERDEKGQAINKEEQRFAKVTYKGTILGITLNGNGVLPTSCSSMKQESM
jgi:hypothetical protein